MAGVWNKMTSVFFQDEEEQIQDNQELQEPTSDKDVWQEPELKKQKKNQIVSIPSNTSRKSMEMVLVKAKSYDDMQGIARNIKEQKVVIVNFEDMDKETAQRMVDFLSGAVFALDGMPKKVSGSTFLFSSSQVDLAGQIMDADGNQSAFSDAINNGNYNIWKR